ncbi:MAG TPA: hypothetical protein DG757_09480 [Bacillus sp. (in: Bacteria)]|nr:hypothetical protein [Bacillus sp. (in: firmicutes)]
MILDTRDAPYLRGTFTIDKTIYLKDIKQTFISAKGAGIPGHSAGINFSSVTKPAIGEFIERQSLFYNYKKNNMQMSAFRLINGDEILVPADKMVFIENFNDSCGVASHLNSKDAILNAFLEFFERQSFIYTWITASQGTLIPDGFIKNNKTTVLYEILNSFVNDIYLFEISLHPIIKVVFGLGIGKYHKATGLSAAFTLEEAIESSLKEMVQCISQKYNKRDIDYFESFDKNDKNDIYVQYYEQFTPNEFLNEFSFLFNRCSKSLISTDKVSNINEAIEIIEKELEIEIYCSLIPTFYKGFRTKIVKVFSPNGYPHMLPVKFDESTTKLVFNKSNKKFPNAYKQIPFP